jgi:DNA alkylation repair enzyme
LILISNMDDKKNSIKRGTPARKGQLLLTAANFITQLKKMSSAAEQKKILRYFKTGKGQYAEGDEFLGVKMGNLFALAVSFNGMPVPEIEKLLESPFHEARAGAVSIMDKESRNKKTSPERRKEFYDLYMRRHDRINNWDLVDLGCLHMTGCHLFNKSRKDLYKLARSANAWKRRTAILSTCYFIRQNELDDTYSIATLLLNDKEDLVHKATGWMLRFAGDKDRKRLLQFLDKHAATMPRIVLRNAIEKFPKNLKANYRTAGRNA